MSENVCKNCKYFCVKKEDSGECRFDSPKAVVVPGQVAAFNVIGCWPPIKEGAWCGKFEPKISLEVK